jgi:hypothetical protein
MKPIQRYFNWINERHKIYLAKERGDAWPWTQDPILQKYKFTNPFRENDRDTKWMRQVWENGRELQTPGELLFNTCFFRIFGGTPFLEAHGIILGDWDTTDTKTLARDMLNKGQKVFTGAYIVTNQGLKLPKEEVVVDLFLKPIWDNRDNLAHHMQVSSSLETSHIALGHYRGWGGGGFMAYEVVTDLNHNGFMPAPEDRLSWANAGPGAKRGLNRIHDRPLDKHSRGTDWNHEMMMLLVESDSYLSRDCADTGMVDMRMIEHSLCEWDKYERVRLGQGTPRSLYRRPK